MPVWGGVAGGNAPSPVPLAPSEPGAGACHIAAPAIPASFLGKTKVGSLRPLK